MHIVYCSRSSSFQCRASFLRGPFSTWQLPISPTLLQRPCSLQEEPLTVYKEEGTFLMFLPETLAGCHIGWNCFVVSGCRLSLSQLCALWNLLTDNTEGSSSKPVSHRLLPPSLWIYFRVCVADVWCNQLGASRHNSSQVTWSFTESPPTQLIPLLCVFISAVFPVKPSVGSAS